MPYNQKFWTGDDIVEKIINSNSNLVLDFNDPVSENDFLNLLRLKVKVASTVYELASPQDIVKGWKEVESKLPLISMTELFHMRYIEYILSKYNTLFLLNKRFSKIKVGNVDLFNSDQAKRDLIKYVNSDIEPYLLDVIRFVFWYSKCASIDKSYFENKLLEIKRKIAMGLLTNIEKYRKRITYSSDQEVQNLITQAINDAPSKDRVYKVYLKEWFIALKSILPELMYAALCSDCRYPVLFPQTKNKNFDYDFTVSELPAQVKSIVTLSDILNDNGVQHTAKTVDRDSTISELTQLLNEKREKLIEHSIEQKAKVVFVNTNSTPAGQKLVSLAKGKGYNMTFNRVLDYIMNDPNNIELYIVCISTANAEKFLVAAAGFEAATSNGDIKIQPISQ